MMAQIVSQYSLPRLLVLHDDFVLCQINSRRGGRQSLLWRHHEFPRTLTEDSCSRGKRKRKSRPPITLKDSRGITGSRDQPRRVKFPPLAGLTAKCQLGNCSLVVKPVYEQRLNCSEQTAELSELLENGLVQPVTSEALADLSSDRTAIELWRSL